MQKLYKTIQTSADSEYAVSNPCESERGKGPPCVRPDRLRLINLFCNLTLVIQAATLHVYIVIKGEPVVLLVVVRD